MENSIYHSTFLYKPDFSADSHEAYHGYPDIRIFSWLSWKNDGIENAVVLISYPKEGFHAPKALRAFISTDVSLSTREILDRYMERWPIEVFFRQAKNRLSFDQYQIRSSQGIRRYWLLMSLAHFLACMECGEPMPFEDGYAFIYNRIQEERIHYIYQCGARKVAFGDVLALAA